MFMLPDIESNYILIIEPIDFRLSHGRYRQHPSTVLTSQEYLNKAFSAYCIHDYKKFNFEIIKHRHKELLPEHSNFNNFLLSVASDYTYIETASYNQEKIFESLCMLGEKWKKNGQLQLVSHISKLIDGDYIKYINGELSQFQYLFPE